jgi:phage/plasmid-associated DNA primase
MDSSSAFFDRWIVLPMTQRFRGTDAQNRDVLAGITTAEELSGLLNQALDGLERLRAHGFTKVASATEAAERFALDADSTAGFIDDCCTVMPTLRVAKPTLYRSYVHWCEESGRMALSAVRFGRRMADGDACSLGA